MFRYANLEMFSPKESDKNKIMYLFEEQIRNLYNLGFYSKKERNTAILNGRFKEGLKCPRCVHFRVNNNGITNCRQRYI